MNRQARQDLLTVYQAALQAVEGRRLVRAWLKEHPSPGPCYVLAVGKAAASMAQGALDQLGDALAEGLVITKHGHGHPISPRITCLEAGHPAPDAGSLAAGKALLAFIGRLPPDVPLLVLLSGGASALVEVLPEGVGLSDLERANQWLLGSGWDIGRMNRVRKALSCIKGGRLARYVQGRPVINLMLSDVPGDDPATIGSGLLAPDPPAGEPLPDPPVPWLRELLGKAAPQPAAGESLFTQIENVVIAGNRTARMAASRKGRELGYAVFEQSELLEGDVGLVADTILEVFLSGPLGLYVWGGEPTVRLPPEPGRGGRAQALALMMATQLDGQAGIWFLAAGTDGSDGPTEDAGALVDGETIERGELAGWDAGDCLRRADSGSFLEGSGDLITTGPTGTNVMDLILALKRSS